MRRQDVLDGIARAYEKMQAALDGLTTDQMLRPGVIDLWSVKDILAHLSAWLSELVTALAHLNPKQPPGILEIEDIDEWNQEQYHTNAPRSLEVILEDFHGVHKHLIKMVESLDDKTLSDPRHFRWMEGEPLAYLIAEDGYLHESEHAAQIAEWRKAQGI